MEAEPQRSSGPFPGRDTCYITVTYTHTHTHRGSRQHPQHMEEQKTGSERKKGEETVEGVRRKKRRGAEKRGGRGR